MGFVSGITTLSASQSRCAFHLSLTAAQLPSAERHVARCRKKNELYVASSGIEIKTPALRRGAYTQGTETDEQV